MPTLREARGWPAAARGASARAGAPARSLCCRHAPPPHEPAVRAGRTWLISGVVVVTLTVKVREHQAGGIKAVLLPQGAAQKQQAAHAAAPGDLDHMGLDLEVVEQ